MKTISPMLYPEGCVPIKNKIPSKVYPPYDLTTEIRNLKTEIRHSGLKDVRLYSDLKLHLTTRKAFKDTWSDIAASPNVLLTFRKGSTEYQFVSDRFTRLEDNIRSLRLSLYHFRKFHDHKVFVGTLKHTA